MKKLLFLLLTLCTTLVCAQDKQEGNKTDDMTMMKNFIKDLSNENKAVDVILSQYLIVEEPTDELYDYLEVSLEEIRLNLMLKNINEIEYINYPSMPKKEIRDIDPEDLDVNNMYFLHYKKRQMLALYLENGKIASFTLVSKGGNKAHFVLY